MADDTIKILDGSTFVVSDARGDVDAGPDEPHGLFYKDTRFLSRWKLTVDGSPPDVLSTDDAKYFEAQFFLVPPTGTIYKNPYLSVLRKRLVGEGFHEDITILNHDAEPAELELRLEVGADFADLFEVKDALVKKGETYAEVRGDELVLGYRRDDFVRETRIRSSAEAELSEDGLRFRVRIEPKSEWSTCLFVVPVAEQACVLKYGHGEDEAKPNIGSSLDDWLEEAPDVASGWDPLEHVYRQSLVDLAALRFYVDDLLPGASRPGRGAAVVHGALRPRQPDHELPGAPVRARAGRDDAARAGRQAGHDASTTSATRSRARSCTSSASAS